MAKNPYTTGGPAKRRVVNTASIPNGGASRTLSTPQAKIKLRQKAKPKVNLSNTYGITNTSRGAELPLNGAVTQGHPSNKNSAGALKGKIRG